MLHKTRKPLMEACPAHWNHMSKRTLQARELQFKRQELRTGIPCDLQKHSVAFFSVP